MATIIPGSKMIQPSLLSGMNSMMKLLLRLGQKRFNRCARIRKEYDCEWFVRDRLG